MNKGTFIGITFTLALAMSGCDTPPPANNPTTIMQCKADNDCKDGCTGFDSFDCRFGVCYCNKKAPTPKEIKCSADKDCTSGCTAGNFDTATCKSGICYCSKIPKACKDVTRDEFVAEMYYFMQYNQCPSSTIKSTCSDVTDKNSACRWAMLSQAGILASTVSQCNPNSFMNRAEVVKIIITAIAGLTGYKAPATATFTDTSKTAWYYDYIEAAVQLGLIVGYKDKNGKLTGKFGPGDTADECWVSNLLWKAAGVSTTTPPPKNISATVTTAMASGIVIGGTSVSTVTYLVNGTSATNPITKLVIINDLQGTFDKAEDTNAVNSLNVLCSPPSGSGSWSNHLGTLVAGKYTFQGLNCYDTTGKGLQIKVAFTPKTITSGIFSVSGKKIRLGILDSSMTVTNQNKIGTFIVRKAKPMFSAGVQSSSSMPSMSGDIYKFYVTAMGGDVSFSRFVFEIQTKGLASYGADIYNFDFRTKSGSVKGQHIWGQSAAGFNAAAVYLKGVSMGSGLQDANTTTAGVDDGKYRVIVTLENEVTVSHKSTELFAVRASIVGATTDDLLSVRLASGDENTEVKLSATYDNDNGFGNCGRVAGNTYVANDSLFDGTSGTGDKDNEYFGDTVADWTTARNIIWSDWSGGSFVSGGSGKAMSSIHSSPKMKGSSTVGTGYIMGAVNGTLDWTNGYLLDTDNLPTWNFKQ